MATYKNSIKLITNNIILNQFSKQKFKKYLFHHFELKKVSLNERIMKKEPYAFNIKNTEEKKESIIHNDKVYFIKKGMFSIQISCNLLELRNLLVYFKEIRNLINKEIPNVLQKFEEINKKEKTEKTLDLNKIIFKFLKNNEIENSQFYIYNIAPLCFDAELEKIIMKNYVFELKILEEEGIIGLLDMFKYQFKNNIIIQHNVEVNKDTLKNAIEIRSIFDVKCISSSAEVFEVNRNAFIQFIHLHQSLLIPFINHYLLTITWTIERFEEFIRKKFILYNDKIDRYLNNTIIPKHTKATNEQFKFKLDQIDHRVRHIIPIEQKNKNFSFNFNHKTSASILNNHKSTIHLTTLQMNKSLQSMQTIDSEKINKKINKLNETNKIHKTIFSLKPKLKLKINLNKVNEDNNILDTIINTGANTCSNNNNSNIKILFSDRQSNQDKSYHTNNTRVSITEKKKETARSIFNKEVLITSQKIKNENTCSKVDFNKLVVSTSSINSISMTHKQTNMKPNYYSLKYYNNQIKDQYELYKCFIRNKINSHRTID